MGKRTRKNVEAKKKNDRDRKRVAREKKRQISQIDEECECSNAHSSELSNIVNQVESQPTVKIVMGTISQAHECFRNPGLQCSVIVLESFRVLLHVEPSNWTPGIIDNIVIMGDRMFNEYVQNSPRMLMCTELPRTFMNDDHCYELEIFDDNFFTGFILIDDNVTEMNNQLLPALKEAFEISNTLFFVFHEYSISLMKCEMKFYIFDSHSRDAEGIMTCSTGTAVLLMFDTIELLHAHLCKLFFSMGLQKNELFEMTPVRLRIMNNVKEQQDIRIENNEGISLERMQPLKLKRKRTILSGSGDDKYAIKKQKQCEKYQTDENYRNSKKKYRKEKYKSDESYRKKSIKEIILKYKVDKNYKQQTIKRIKLKYQRNIS